ncbi:GAP family protein [Streptomyces collinus]|uniref:GAP family protein n=1 Tax=Streptomyces collinus TaxID=42684 RepID=UPI0029425005|nr:GAP family protein [Streptomyces collinus]
MVLDLLLIALAITLDPLPLMAFVLVVASTGGARKGLVFLLSWLACLVLVIAIVLALTGGQPPPPRSPPSAAALGVKLAVGVALVAYGEHRRRRLAAVRALGGPAQDPRAELAAGAPVAGAAAVGADEGASSARLTTEMDRTTNWAAAGLAVLLQPWGLVAAGATTVVEADTSHLASWFALFVFCVLATASLLAVELYVVFSPTAAKARLLALRAWMEQHSEQAVVALCLLLGFWLVAKSIYQLTG